MLSFLVVAGSFVLFNGIAVLAAKKVTSSGRIVVREITPFEHQEEAVTLARLIVEHVEWFKLNKSKPTVEDYQYIYRSIRQFKSQTDTITDRDEMYHKMNSVDNRIKAIIPFSSVIEEDFFELFYQYVLQTMDYALNWNIYKKKKMKKIECNLTLEILHAKAEKLKNKRIALQSSDVNSWREEYGSKQKALPRQATRKVYSQAELDSLGW